MDWNFKHFSCRGPFSSFFPAAAPVAMSIDVTLIVSDTVGGSPQFAMNIICTKDGFSMIFDDVQSGSWLFREMDTKAIQNMILTCAQCEVIWHFNMTSCYLMEHHEVSSFEMFESPGPQGQNLNWRRLDVSWSLLIFRTKFSGWWRLVPWSKLFTSLHCRMFLMFYDVWPFWLSTWLWFFASGKTITFFLALRISKSSLCRSLRRSPRSVTPSCPGCDVVLSCADCAGLAAPASVQLRRAATQVHSPLSSVVHIPGETAETTQKAVFGKSLPGIRIEKSLV